MRVVITGAGGQFGSAVVSELAQEGVEIVPLTRRELDVTDPELAAKISRLRASVVINCTAWNDVDDAERSPESAYSVNRDAVRELAAACDRCNAMFVHYSTDFVFDGEACQLYQETAVPRPVNRYGESKLAGEREARRVPLHYVLRLSSVFGGRPGEGAGGRNTIDKLIAAALAGSEVRAFTDRTVSPSYTVNVARATRMLDTRQPPPGIYHCAATGYATW